MKKMGTIVLALFLLIAPVAYGLGPWSMTLSPPAKPIPEHLFGMHLHHLLVGAREKTPWPSVRFGSWRLWGIYLYWSRLESQKDKWDFSAADKYVKMAEQHHVDVLLTLGITPEWASSHPSQRSDFNPGGAAPPKEMTDWRNYVQEVATRYKGRIHEYEIWNEPNLKNYYTGSIPEMVQLAKVAYTTLKRVDPSNVVVSPSATGTASGLTWLASFLRAGGGKYADIIGYHFYVNPAPPEDMVPLIQRVEQIMTSNGVGNKPLWDTETGWAIQDRQDTVRPEPGGGFNSVVLSENQAPAYVARAYILAWAAGVSRLYWYDWDGDKMGLVELDGKTLKPAAIAYEQVQNWMVGAQMKTCVRGRNGIWVCLLAQPNNHRSRIIWRPDKKQTFLIPKDWNVREVRTLDGRTIIPPADGVVTIGPSPVLLVSPGN